LRVPSADADIAAPRARIKPGIANVANNPISEITKSKSIRLKPDSLLSLMTRVEDMMLTCHLTIIGTLPFCGCRNLAVPTAIVPITC